MPEGIIQVTVMCHKPNFVPRPLSVLNVTYRKTMRTGSILHGDEAITNQKFTTHCTHRYRSSDAQITYKVAKRIIGRMLNLVA